MTEERKHSIDKLFHSSLDGQKIEPSADVWQSLSKFVPGPKSGSGYMFVITAIAIGALTFLLHSGVSHNESFVEADAITLQVDEPNEKIADQVPAMRATFNESELIAGPELVNETSASAAKVDDSETVAITETSETQKNSNPSNDAVVPAVSYASIAGASVKLLTEEKESIFADELTSENIALAHLEPKSASISSDNSRSITRRENKYPLQPIFDLTLKDSYAEKANVLLGAGLSPAVNIYPDGQNRNDYSFDLVASYEKSRFILETGMGASFTTESAKYQVNYTSYDSVGFYFGVSSFTTDPANPDSIIFHTNMKSIYDSIDHYNVYENTNKYTYLQIPIRVGYRLIQKERFSLDLKLGLLFSLQVYKDIPEIPYRGNDADQIKVIRQYPDRLSTHWQYTAGLSINYQINEQIRFSIEPFYRQYLKSVYSSGSSYSARSPYGFGIRGGIYFHF